MVFRSSINSRTDAVTGGVVPDASIIRPIPDFMQKINNAVIDAPMVRLVGKGAPYDALKLEFGITEYAPITDTLGAAISDTTGTTGYTVTATTGNAFQLWDRFAVATTTGVDPAEDAEQFLVTGISGNTLTCTRKFAGTTGATALNGSRILILGPAVPENVDTPRSPLMDGSLDFNYPEEFGYSFQISGRARNTPRMDIRGDQYETRLAEKMKEAIRDLDLTLLRGKRAVGDGSATNPSAMGGLLQFTNFYKTDMGGAPLTLNAINTQAQTVARDVGKETLGKTIMGNYDAKRFWNSLFDERKVANSTDEATKLTYSTVETDFGTFKFVINDRMPPGMVVGWNTEYAKLRPYTGRGNGGDGGDWYDTPLPASGRYDIGALIGDFHFDVRFERSRWKLYNFSTTYSDYGAAI